ncbi:unnamed protein product [Phytomonas sp. EM1]|nr:unnamed protein product [Phytomonas sp. EM1]|eukprot:CCW64185.1 unnamed protein product [Phytomonas sp. isolate EM1]
MSTDTYKVTIGLRAPPMDYRQFTREKVNRKRADMYTSSRDSFLKLNPEARKKIYNPLPKEVFIENTQQAAEHAKRVEAEESGAPIWPQAGIVPRNRCREWRENGFGSIPSTVRPHRR